MAVLTVDVGGSPVSINCTRGGHAPPRRVGNKSTGNSGAEESSVRAELMVVPIITDPISLATAATLRAKFAIGNQVPCAGDIFNVPGTITCSGLITDELRETADSVVLNLTLYEIGTDLTYAPIVTRFILTGVLSPDAGGDPDVFVSTPDGSYPGDASTSFDIMPDDDPPTCSGAPFTACSTIFSDVPERSWLSVPLAAAQVAGALSVSVSANGPAGDVWAHASFLAKIYHVRSGADIAGPFTTGYVGGSLFGGDVTTPPTAGVSLTLQDGDRLRVEFWGRLALLAGETDDADRMTIFHGVIPNSTLNIAGVVTSL